MPGDKSPHWGSFMGTGLEMAVGVAVGYFGGHWIGKRYGWDPAATLIGAMVGLIAGAYLLIKEMNKMDNDSK